MQELPNSGSELKAQSSSIEIVDSASWGAQVITILYFFLFSTVDTCSSFCRGVIIPCSLTHLAALTLAYWPVVTSELVSV